MLAFLTLLWGTSFLLIKIAARAFEPFAFALGRVGVAMATLALVALVARWRWPRGVRLWSRLAAISWIGQVTPFVLLGEAARLTTSADLALMMGGAPIFVFVASRLLGLGEPWSLRAAVGLALGFAGVAVSLGFPFAAESHQYPHAGWGRALGLLAAFGYASSAMLSRSASQEIGPFMAATASLAVSTFTLLAITLVRDGPRSPPAMIEAPVGPLAALFALGFFNTALAYLVYFRLVVVAGATFASLNNYVVPFVGLVVGALTLGEPVGVSSWIGFALVMTGVALTGHAGRGRNTAAPRRQLGARASS